MAFVYEVNGQRVEFDREPTTADIDEAASSMGSSVAATGTGLAAESSLKSFGKSAVSLVDTGLNMVSGLADSAAYPLANAYYGTVGGMNPQAAANRAQQETTTPKNVIGSALGITQDSAYKNEMSQRAMNAVGKGIAGLAEPVAQTTGIPQYSVENMIGTATLGMAPAAGAVAKPIVAAGQGIKAAGSAALDTGRGFAGILDGTIAKPGQTPAWGQTASSRQPVNPSGFIPADQLAQYRAGTLKASEVTQQPWSTVDKAALDRTQGMVPLDNKIARAVGEQLAEPYSSVKGWLPDIALGGIGTALGVGPSLNLMRKGYQAYRSAKDITAANKLGEYGFTPMSAAESTSLTPVKSAAPGGGINNLAPASNSMSLPTAETTSAKPTGSPKRSPPGTMQMIVDESQWAGGTWDKPLPHSKAIEKINNHAAWGELVSDKPLNIVGQNANGSIKYTVRDSKTNPGNRSISYDVLDPKTGKELYNVSKESWPSGANSMLVKTRSGYDYAFTKGRLSKIVDLQGRAHTPNMASFDKQPKIDMPDIMDLIKKIKK